MQNDILQTDCRAEAVITSPMLLLAEPPAELVRIAYEPLQDAAPQVVDLLHVVPLLRAETYNLPGLEPAVVEQIGQSALALCRQHALEGLPQFAALGLFFSERLPQLTWLRQGDLLRLM